VPILVWRSIFAVVHLDEYWPYLVVLLLLHVFVVHLFWRRCLREHVDPWVATVMALLMALLGSAAEDLTWAFQIGFLGSMCFGLIALELLEPRRRSVLNSALASLAALAALMCSDIGVAMLGAFALLALARRGWLQAGGIVGPPALAFVVWFVLIGRSGIAGDHMSTSIVLGIPRFVWDDSRTDLARIFSLGSVHLGFLATALVIGLLVWLAWGGLRLARQHPAVVALLGADIVFHVLAALGRERFGETFSPSRYVYIDFILLLPALGVAMGWRPRGVRSALAPVARVLAVLLLAACTAGNLVQGAEFARARTSYVLRLKQEIEGSAELLAEGEPAIAVHPIRYAGLTTQGLLSLDTYHLVPRPRLTEAELYTDQGVLDLTVTRKRLERGRFRLLLLSGGALGRSSGPGCVTVWARRSARSPRILLGLVNPKRPGAVLFSGRAAELVGFLVAGRQALPAQVGAVVNVPKGGGWVDDGLAESNVLLEVPAGHSRFCDLGLRAERARQV
jgi:hypothetical protein